jgi:hypothetical protein
MKLRSFDQFDVGRFGLVERINLMAPLMEPKNRAPIEVTYSTKKEKVKKKTSPLAPFSPTLYTWAYASNVL